MRNHVVVLLGIALILPVVTGPASGASAKARKPRSEVRELLTNTFTNVGEFSGELGGTISFNGTLYQIAPDATIYEIGRGMMPRGTVLARRMIAVCGVTVGGSSVINQIIVRPAQMGVAGDGPIKTAPAGSGRQ